MRYAFCVSLSISIISRYILDDENGNSQKIEADAHLCWSLELFTNFVILRKIFLLAVLLIAIEIHILKAVISNYNSS